jgi:hypothetical protein
LYQNSIQKTFEFRILASPDNDPFIERLASGVTHLDAVSDCHAYARRVIDFNGAEANAFGLDADSVAKIILLTDTRFSDNFYLVGTMNWTFLRLVDGSINSRRRLSWSTT